MLCSSGWFWTCDPPTSFSLLASQIPLYTSKTTSHVTYSSDEPCSKAVKSKQTKSRSVGAEKGEITANGCEFFFVVVVVLAEC